MTTSRSGKIVDFFKGKSVAGADLELPRIKTTKFEVVNATALDPAIVSIDVGETKNLAGVRISVLRAEISEKQTRIWVRYKNNSRQDFADLPSLTARGKQVDQGIPRTTKHRRLRFLPGPGLQASCV